MVNYDYLVECYLTSIKTPRTAILEDFQKR